MENQYSILQKEREKKQRIKSRILTTILVFIFVVLLLFFNYTFFLAPYLENKQQEETALTKLNTLYTSDEIKKHEFNLKTYVVEKGNFVFIYDEKGDLIASKNRYNNEKVNEKTKAKNMENVRISAGYGYDAPAIVIENDEKLLLLDYDSYDIIYFGEKR